MTNNKFLNGLAKAASDESISITENGAAGYARTNHALTDFFYKIGSMRSWDSKKIINEFMPVYAEDKRRAFELLFFIRDCRGGQGERRVFNILFGWIIKTDPSAAIALLPLIPEFGSWKAFFEMTPYFLSASKDVVEAACSFFADQWDKDIDAMDSGKSASLMAKWAPSCNASSKVTKDCANYWRRVLGITEKEYRKTLASLRDYLKVLETKLSANKWSEIDYNAVPSRAGVIYRGAFLKHDEDRRRKWLEDLKKPESGAKINVGVLDVVTIVQKYMANGWYSNRVGEEDATLEAAWKALVEKGRLDESAPNMIPVIDGSGSMYSWIAGNDGPMAEHVALALGLYFANINKGVWNGQVIAFGSRPQFYKVPTDASLRDQLALATRYNDCGTTDVEAVFKLVLKTAVDNGLSQEEIPSLVVFSDMEFNFAMENPSARLFDEIGRAYKAKGYSLPKLFFWNICSRTGTIPLTENDLGVGLISGFNQSICKMLLTGKLDPYEIIVEQLDAPRYDPVRKAIKELSL